MTTRTVRGAIEQLRVRLDRIQDRLSDEAFDPDSYVERLAEIEVALNSLGVTVGLERRSVRLRATVRHASAETLPSKQAA